MQGDRFWDGEECSGGRYLHQTKSRECNGSTEFFKKMSYDYAKKPSLTDCCTMTRIILLKTLIFQGRLPVKWTAYEALLYGTYTTQSDV